MQTILVLRILIKVPTYLYILSLLFIHSVYGISGNFNNGKYKLAYILTVVKNCGSKMCMLKCARLQGCNGVNYDQFHLYCELLMVTAGDDLIDKPGFRYAAIAEWTIENDVCQPNPCRQLQKCVITYNNLPLCVDTDVVISECTGIKKTLGAKHDGVYKLHKNVQESLFCDMTTDNGGWTVFQQRVNGLVEFYRGYNEYKIGFGNLNGEFWLGNDKLHAMTISQNYELRIDLEKFDGVRAYAVYSQFVIGDETSGYKLTVSGYSGTAGDGLVYHNGQKFSTYDNDHSTAKCPSLAVGAWWYLGCSYSNLNGEYLQGPTGAINAHRGVNWYYFSGWNYSLKKSKMMIRPIL